MMLSRAAACFALAAVSAGLLAGFVQPAPIPVAPSVFDARTVQPALHSTIQLPADSNSLVLAR